MLTKEEWIRLEAAINVMNVPIKMGDSECISKQNVKFLIEHYVEGVCEEIIEEREAVESILQGD